jgi:hypothetical protein
MTTVKAADIGVRNPEPRLGVKQPSHSCLSLCKLNNKYFVIFLPDQFANIQKNSIIPMFFISSNPCQFGIKSICFILLFELNTAQIQRMYVLHMFELGFIQARGTEL